jgi:hypothetical protein
MTDTDATAATMATTAEQPALDPLNTVAVELSNWAGLVEDILRAVEAAISSTVDEDTGESLHTFLEMLDGQRTRLGCALTDALQAWRDTIGEHTFRRVVATHYTGGDC